MSIREKEIEKWIDERRRVTVMRFTQGGMSTPRSLKEISRYADGQIGHSSS
jgi:hypothetical protein